LPLIWSSWFGCRASFAHDLIFLVWMQSTFQWSSTWSNPENPVSFAPNRIVCRFRSSRNEHWTNTSQGAEDKENVYEIVSIHLHVFPSYKRAIVFEDQVSNVLRVCSRSPSKLQQVNTEVWACTHNPNHHEYESKHLYHTCTGRQQDQVYPDHTQHRVTIHRRHFLDTSSLRSHHDLYQRVKRVKHDKIKNGNKDLPKSPQRILSRKTTRHKGRTILNEY